MAKKLGKQGRKWVSDSFGWATIAPKVEKLIIDEVEKRR